jgi:CRISPR-associated protein Csm3
MEKWKANIVITGKIIVLTGLHIGGGTETVKIGGTDSPVAKTRMQAGKRKFDVPYIPGSSLKGKMRSMLRAFYQESGLKPGNRALLIDTIFGQALGGEPKQDSRTRIIFRDCFPTADDEGSDNLVRSLTEIKAENSIKLEDSRAVPRFIERVVPFTSFDMECVLSVLEGDSEQEMVDLVKEGFRLIEDSYLGGSGTRGYGKVSFKDLSFGDRRSRDYYEGQVTR